MSSNGTTTIRFPGSAARGAAALVCVGLGAAGCTGQLPGGFRLQQQTQTFASQIHVNTKVDLLWVVDNSSSMDVDQQKLRDGFSAFARKYMQPTWDIRAAVITTDTYLAHPAFAGYLASTVPGTSGWKSPYIAGRIGTFQNPSYAPNLVDATGTFTNGITINQMIPVWGPSFSQLLPGLHDGPTTALCFEGMPYFLNGETHCATRDNQTNPLYQDASHCLTPNASGGETSLSQCVNTVENNTVRSHQAIISTMPPAGTPGDAAWTQGLVNNFMINVSTGSAGHGSERGLGSVLQLLLDNEGKATAFFRPGSTRAIIFVSDEDDQTFYIEKTPPAGFSPWTHYMCDQASLVAMNGSAPITGTNGFCCTSPANNCRFGAEGTSCPAKTVDSYGYTISVCPRSDLLMPVSAVKQQLDGFFDNLDQIGGVTGITGVVGSTGYALTGMNAVTVAPTGSQIPVSNPNYFVVSIVAQTGQAVQTLQASRNQDDVSAGALKTVATDRADRYMQLGEQVGNGSMTMNIADSDYSPILDAIGQAIIEKAGTFTLSRAPTGAEDMIVSVIHADGSTTVIGSDKFTISGKRLIINDLNTILSFAATDQISINYQPKTVY